MPLDHNSKDVPTTQPPGHMDPWQTPARCPTCRHNKCDPPRAVRWHGRSVFPTYQNSTIGSHQRSKRRSREPVSHSAAALSAVHGHAQIPDHEDEVFVLPFRIWLKDVSPMVWRRAQVPSTTTLHEFHGVLQVVVGWEGIHLIAVAHPR